MNEDAKVTDGAEAGSQAETADSTAGDVKTYNQSELDSEVGRAVASAIKKFTENKLPGLLEQAKQEWEETAKLSAEEQARVKFEKDQKALDAARQAFSREKLELDAMKELTKRQIPGECAEFVIGEDAETTTAKIDKFETVLDTIVQARVDARLKGGEPPKAPGGAPPDALGLKDQIAQQLGVKL